MASHAALCPRISVAVSGVSRLDQVIGLNAAHATPLVAAVFVVWQPLSIRASAVGAANIGNRFFIGFAFLCQLGVATGVEADFEQGCEIDENGHNPAADQRGLAANEAQERCHIIPVLFDAGGHPPHDICDKWGQATLPQAVPGGQEQRRGEMGRKPST